MTTDLSNFDNRWSDAILCLSHFIPTVKKYVGANTKCRIYCQVFVLRSRVVWKKGQKGQWGGAERIKKWQKVVVTHGICILGK